MKRLYRSRTEKTLAGVCGGIGEYFEIDPTMVRLAWILFAFVGGSGIIAYIIAAIVIPQIPMGYTQPGPEGTWQVGADQSTPPPRDAQYTSYQQSTAQGQAYQQPGQQAQTNPQGQPYYGQPQQNPQGQPYYGQPQPNPQGQPYYGQPSQTTQQPSGQPATPQQPDQQPQ